MSATHRAVNWRRVSLLGKAWLLLASIISALVGVSGILLYPLILLAFSNPILCLIVVTLGVWFGCSARNEPWLALAMGNGAVIVGAVAFLVDLHTASETAFATAVFFTAAALILGGYSLLAGWLIRQLVRRLQAPA